MAGLAHLGIGLAAKSWAPKAPIGILAAAAMALDLLYTLFVILGVEAIGRAHWSHGLFMAVIWSLLTGVVGYLFSREFRLSLVLGGLVCSHWVIDFITWPMQALQADARGIPLLFDGSLEIGLGLYRLLPVAVVIDLGAFLIGLAVYLRIRKKQ